jgi:hypothetical protein
MIIVLLVVSLVGVAILSIVIAIIIVHFLLKGLEAVALRVISPRYEIRDGNEYQRDHNNNSATANDIPIHPDTISRYDLYEIIRNLIKPSENQIGKQCPCQKTNTDKKEYYRYINRFLPRLAPCSLPLPIKHIGSIVDRLIRLIRKCQPKWNRTAGSQPVDSLNTLC